MGVGTKGYTVWWREGGGAYASTGEPATIVEVIGASNATTLQSTVGGLGLKFPFLDFLAGFVRLKNGVYVLRQQIDEALWLARQLRARVAAA